MKLSRALQKRLEYAGWSKKVSRGVNKSYYRPKTCLYSKIFESNLNVKEEKE